MENMCSVWTAEERDSQGENGGLQRSRIWRKSNKSEKYEIRRFPLELMIHRYSASLDWFNHISSPKLDYKYNVHVILVASKSLSSFSSHDDDENKPSSHWMILPWIVFFDDRSQCIEFNTELRTTTNHSLIKYAPKNMQWQNSHRRSIVSRKDFVVVQHNVIWLKNTLVLLENVWQVWTNGCKLLFVSSKSVFSCWSHPKNIFIEELPIKTKD